MFAFFSHHHVFYGQLFEEILLFFLRLFQPLYFLLLLADDAQFPPYEPFCCGLLYVVSAVYGQEEILQKRVEVLLVECLCGFMILIVGLAF